MYVKNYVCERLNEILTPFLLDYIRFLIWQSLGIINYYSAPSNAAKQQSTMLSK